MAIDDAFLNINYINNSAERLLKTENIKIDNEIFKKIITKEPRNNDDLNLFDYINNHLFNKPSSLL